MAHLQQKEDLTGKVFTRLTVLRFYSVRNRQRMWLCKCDCGNINTVSTADLNKGHTKSCGCYGKSLGGIRTATHRKSNSNEYSIWHNMKRRCEDPGHKNYDRYGGRGITVCQEWKSFINFYNDMGNVPSDKYTIERVNNDSGYCRENCKWATRKEQANNTRNTNLNKIEGTKLSNSDMAEHIGITRKTLEKYYKQGFTAQQIKSIFSMNVSPKKLAYQAWLNSKQP